MPQKKIALITGANKGIGFESARQLGAHNVTIIVGARSDQKASDAAAKLESEGIDAVPLKLDVSVDADWTAAAKFISNKFGKLDILINNAGIITGEPFFGNSASTVSADSLRAVYATNFIGLVGLTQALLPLIKKSEAGRIVNVTSILGSLTLNADPKAPIAGSKALGYNSTKAALNAFTILLAAELKDTNIKVNSAHPGWVKTELGGEGAQLEISEGAKTQVALALLGPDGPTGTYTHLGQTLPW